MAAEDEKPLPRTYTHTLESLLAGTPVTEADLLGSLSRPEKGLWAEHAREEGGRWVLDDELASLVTDLVRFPYSFREWTETSGVNYQTAYSIFKNSPLRKSHSGKVKRFGVGQGSIRMDSVLKDFMDSYYNVRTFPKGPFDPEAPADVPADVAAPFSAEVPEALKAVHEAVHAPVPETSFETPAETLGGTTGGTSGAATLADPAVRQLIEQLEIRIAERDSRIESLEAQVADERDRGERALNEARAEATVRETDLERRLEGLQDRLNQAAYALGRSSQVIKRIEDASFSTRVFKGRYIALIEGAKDDAGGATYEVPDSD